MSLTRRTSAAVAGMGSLAALLWAARELPSQFGAAATGARRERVEKSPQYAAGQFHNRPHPARDATPMSATLRQLTKNGDERVPRLPVPLVHDTAAASAAAAAGAHTAGLRVTWLGHATVLLELDDRRILIDPVWSDRCSPSSLVGPKRLHDVPVALADLPPIDAVVISHDHYDHLDMPTIKALASSTSAQFVVPLAIGAHLQSWGVPVGRITELDWNESTSVAGVRLVCSPAQHFSGRSLRDRDRTLWASWVIADATHKVFYSGDGGYFDGFTEIGAAEGPFDVALIQVGAYSESWPDIHMTPEEGIATAVDVGAALVVPVHWGTFRLAPHPWSEPVDRLWAEAKARDVRIVVPRPGERIDPSEVGDVDPWWTLIAPRH
ncbi:MAG: MBL fold metallo-hydrolase [Nostocoides sp.]